MPEARDPTFVPNASRTTAEPGAPATTPEELPSLDGYDLVGRTGIGGMGVVYEAYQQATGRRVAVKFMRTAAAVDDAARRRFEREVELVARLQHPHIVSVIDSGLHRGGYYYVMDFIEGRPLDEVYPPGAAPPRAVLATIRAVAEAVDYAHQRGVLHRDLKPSNILIDARGEPKLLDFGLAKAIDPQHPEEVETTLSQPGQLLGTLGYMSPEQSRGQIAHTSLRSDVYSLGAITYELLTGRLPCTLDGALHEMLKRISLVDPPRPSSVRAGLDADIDAILLKAMEKQPSDRYATAADFAADIGRYLADEPIHARPAGPAVRVTRWVRRNRAVSTVGAVALVVVLLVAGLAFARVLRERDRARKEARVAAEAARWVDDAMRLVSPEVRPDKEVTLRDLYDAQVSKLTAEPPAEPEVRAAILARLGNNARALGLYDDARLHLQRAADLRRTLANGPDSELAQSLHDLAALLYDRGAYAEAESLYREALTMRLALLEPQHDDVIQSRNHLAAVLTVQGRHAEAEVIFRDLLQIRREVSGEHSLETAAALNNLAACLRDQQRFREAEPLYRQSLELIESIGGEDHRYRPSALQNVADCLVKTGRYEEAEPLLLLAIDLKKRRLEDDHPSMAKSLQSLAELRLGQGRLEEAAEHCARALEIRRAKLGPDHRETKSSEALLERIRGSEP